MWIYCKFWHTVHSPLASLVQWNLNIMKEQGIRMLFCFRLAQYMNIFICDHTIKNICFAIIVQHTWAVVLLFFLFHLPAKELCDILLTAGLYSFLFMIGLLLCRWIKYKIKLCDQKTMWDQIPVFVISFDMKQSLFMWNNFIIFLTEFYWDHLNLIEHF